MLNILMVTETSGGGTGRHMIDLTRQFLIRGHRVHLVYAPNRAEARFLQDVSELQRLDRLTTSSFEMKRRPGLSDFVALRRLKADIQAHGPFDILHGHSSKAGALVRLMPGRMGAHVYTPHALKVMDPEAGWLSKLAFGSIEAGLGRWASDALIAVSPMEREQCIALGIPPERVHLVINGIDPKVTATPSPSREELGLMEDLHIFGYVGRFAAQKAPERLIRAFTRLGPDARAGLLMVGDGPGRKEMEAEIASAGLTDRVYFAGLTPGEPFFHLMDSFVLPSRFESMPYVLLEAAQFGLPILSTNVSGSDLMVRHGHNGLVLANTDDPEPMAAAMRAMLDSTCHARMKAAAQNEIGRYSLSNMAEDTLQVYEQVIKARRGRRRAA